MVITKPWHTVCVDLIGPYTPKGKNGTVIDFMCLTMIDPATSWFEIVELPVVQCSVTSTAKDIKGQKGKKTPDKEPYFDKSSAMISKLVNKTWFCRYPRCSAIIYDNGSEFKLHFQSLCDTYGLKRKPTTVKNPQANAILERLHQTLAAMMCTAELDMANSLEPSDIDDFLNNAAWAVRSTSIQCSKPLQEQQFFDGTCCLTSLSLLNGSKLETIGNARLIAIQHVKTQNGLIGIIQLVTKY